MAADGSNVLRVAYVGRGDAAATPAVAAFDAATGAAVPDTGGAAPALAGPGETTGGEAAAPRRNVSLWKALVDGSKEVHDGRYFGAAGQLVIGLAALMMPVLLISGYMMYLNRRRRKVTWTTRVRRS